MKLYSGSYFILYKECHNILARLQHRYRNKFAAFSFTYKWSFNCSQMTMFRPENDGDFTSKADCKTMATTFIFIRSYNTFALNPQHAFDGSNKVLHMFVTHSVSIVTLGFLVKTTGKHFLLVWKTIILNYYCFTC